MRPPKAFFPASRRPLPPGGGAQAVAPAWRWGAGRCVVPCGWSCAHACVRAPVRAAARGGLARASHCCGLRAVPRWGHVIAIICVAALRAVSCAHLWHRVLGCVARCVVGAAAIVCVAALSTMSCVPLLRSCAWLGSVNRCVCVRACWFRVRGAPMCAQVAARWFVVVFYALVRSSAAAHARDKRTRA